MPKPGQKKMPKAVAIAKGNYRPSRYEDELGMVGLQYLTSVPPFPESLNEDGQGLWNSVISQAILIEGYFAVTDIMMFEQLCYTFQLIQEAQRNIKKYGMYRATAEKDIKITAFTRSYMELTKMYINLCREFGLSPSSRTGIKFMERGDLKPESLSDFKI